MVLSFEIKWHLIKYKSWWRNQMKLSALLVIYAGNSPVTGHQASIQLHAASECWGTITTVNLQCVSYWDTAVCIKPSKYIIFCQILHVIPWYIFPQIMHAILGYIQPWMTCLFQYIIWLSMRWKHFPRHCPFCERNPPLDIGYPSQRASNTGLGYF